MSENTTDKFIIVGDRVLLKPKSINNQTNAGLYLPPGVKENEKIQSGYVIKVGPGYPLPVISDEDEPWKRSSNSETVKYIPLQAQVGDLAIYLQQSGFEIEYEQEKYVIVPQNAILLLIREDY
jgi:chaperonin GroES